MKKLYCFLFGHDFLSLFTMDNGSSRWGEHKCMRCEKTEAWQWDR